MAVLGLTAVVCATGDAAPSIERMEADLVRRVNAARREHKLPPLQTDGALAGVARAYSCRMAAERFLGHEAPDGSTLADRVRGTGKAYRLVGENLAMNVNVGDPVAAAVAGWMKSASHRENILRAEFTQAGVGICRRDTRHYFTQLFLRS